MKSQAKPDKQFATYRWYVSQIDRLHTIDAGHSLIVEEIHQIYMKKSGRTGCPYQTQNAILPGLQNV